MKVLYEETLKIEHFKWSGNVILTLVLCIIVAIVITLIFYHYISDDSGFITIIIIILIVATVFITMSRGCIGNESYQTLYYLTIDEHTSWNDVNDKFEIVEQKGDLIVAKKKPE